MDEGMYTAKARQLVFNYVKTRLEKTDTHVTFAEDEVYVVWFAKVLQNWKALVSTTLPDQMYYEVTYDGDKQQTYIDAYKKWDNVAIPDVADDSPRSIYKVQPNKGDWAEQAGPFKWPGTA